MVPREISEIEREDSTVSTTNLSPNTRVPKSGLYYCTMCKEGDSAIRDELTKYAREKGVDPRMLEGIFGAAGIGRTESTTRKSFKVGDTFGECSRHGQATGWTLEREDETQATSTVPENPKTETVLMECPPFPGQVACSDNDCPCPNTTMPPAKGYLWIKKEIVDTRMTCLSLQALQGFMSMSGVSSIDEVRRHCLPIVVCEQSATRRGLDLTVAASDYLSWVKTGKVPCRATPLAVAPDAAKKMVSSVFSMVEGEGLSVTIDQDRCIGCGLCADTCPSVFNMNGEVAEARRSAIAPDELAACHEATNCCPVEAIALIDHTPTPAKSTEVAASKCSESIKKEPVSQTKDEAPNPVPRKKWWEFWK